MVARPHPSFNADQVIEIYGIRLPVALEPVATAIEESRSLLHLEDDWDGEGTPGFAEPTWRRAAEFVAHGAVQLYERHGIVSDDVEILPAPGGGLGVDWRTGRRELLVTVPADVKEDALFYGDDGAGRRKIKGTLDTSAPNRWLTEWLAE